MSAENVFSRISDDVVLNIFSKLEDDPRNWSRLACVSPKFSALIRTVCLPTKCSQTIPSLVSNLLPSSAGWASLYKLSVCCPGLLYSGVLLENSDFGLERELGPDEEYRENKLYIQSCHQQQPQPATTTTPAASSCCTSSVSSDCTRPDVANDSDCSWSLYDDLYFDTVYNASESSLDNAQIEVPQPDVKENVSAVKPAREFSVCKRRKICRSLRSHLASGVWNLSREQGNKLLASRFRGDCLYICDWPGCVHIEEKRNYMLFRGIFKNFKKSRVWRTINDGNRSKVDLNCAYCPSKQVWDLHSAFCLRPAYGFHDDGEPVVRAYVCENGHVSGAWTDWPLYT